MNDDLDVRGAFDAVYEQAAELAEIQAHERLSPADARRTARILQQIDDVWQILGP